MAELVITMLPHQNSGHEDTIFRAKSRIHFALEGFLESVAWFCSVMRSSLEQMSEAEGGCSLPCQGCVQEGALPWFHRCHCVLIKFNKQIKRMILSRRSQILLF